MLRFWSGQGRHLNSDFYWKALMWHNHSSPGLARLGPAQAGQARHNLPVGQLCTASLQMYHRHLTSQQDATTVWVCTVVWLKHIILKGYLAHLKGGFWVTFMSEMYIFLVEVIYFLIFTHSYCCPVFYSLSATLLLKLHEQVCKYGLLNPHVNIGPSNTGVFPWFDHSRVGLSFI